MGLDLSHKKIDLMDVRLTPEQMAAATAYLRRRDEPDTDLLLDMLGLKGDNDGKD